MSADSIIVKAGLKDAAFHAGIGRMKAAGKGLSRALGLIGVSLSVGTLTAIGRQSLKLADDLGTAAATIGVTTDELQEFTYAAEQNGISTDKATMGLQRFVRRLAQAQQGAGELLPTLQQLGIQIFNADGSARSAADVMNDFADAVANIKDPQAQLLAGFKAFDSEGAQLIAMLKKGSGELETLRQKAREAGVVLDTETIAELDHADKAIKRVGQQVKIFFAKWTGGAFFALRATKRIVSVLKDELGRRLGSIGKAIKALFKLDFDGAAAAMFEYQRHKQDITDLAAEAIVDTQQQIDLEKTLADESKRHAENVERGVKAMEMMQRAAAKVKEAQAKLDTAMADRSRFSGDDLAKLAKPQFDPILQKILQQTELARLGLRKTGTRAFFGDTFERFDTSKIDKAARDQVRVNALEDLARALAEKGQLRRSQNVLKIADNIRRNNPFLKTAERDPLQTQRDQLKAAKEQLAELKTQNARGAPDGPGIKTTLHYPA